MVEWRAGRSYWHRTRSPGCCLAATSGHLEPRPKTTLTVPLSLEDDLLLRFCYPVLTRSDPFARPASAFIRTNASTIYKSFYKCNVACTDSAVDLIVSKFTKYVSCTYLFGFVFILELLHTWVQFKLVEVL